MAFEVDLNVTLTYSEEVNREDARNWVEGALEHCRQENMLSDPHVEVTCDEIRVSIVEDYVEEEVREESSEG